MTMFPTRDCPANGIYLDMDDDEIRAYKSGRCQDRPRRRLWIILVLAALAFLLLSMGLWMASGDVYAAAKARHGEVAPASGKLPPPVVLISIDGFRYDYLERGLTPNLKWLAEGGIYGPMLPQFPSYTFPNHFTLVTGLYPENHGIVANAFYDPQLDDYFSYTNQRNLRQSKWWDAVPIWNTVQDFGLKSATMFWPGSESSIRGKRPNYYHRYDGTVGTEDRVGQVLNWLGLSAAERPSFIAMYLSVVDDAGHRYGPNSLATDAALVEVDRGIGLLLKGLKARGILDAVNLVIVSDHGMREVRNDYHIYLDDLVSDMKKRLRWVDYGPVASIVPVNETETLRVYGDLKAAEAQGHPFKVYLKSQLPDRYHFRNNARIAPIIVVAEPGWIVDFREGNWVPRGIHGYDPLDPEMQALFVARGPGLKSVGRTQHTQPLVGVSNLDVYPFLARLMNIPALPNNGTLRLVEMCIRSPRSVGK